ncbi:hypothetical protein CBM2623_B170494 [Cupriavidus taiwanensis]|nr:hypothetical protein CBM2608_B140562 [Cupriavidus taiwanensis]SPA33450.1 hypothetical protein CBM2623_B170494 [Cupriavidus taiwanensis]
MRWRGGGKGRRIHEVNGINHATYAIPRGFGDDQKKTRSEERVSVRAGDGLQYAIFAVRLMLRGSAGWM